MEEVPAHWRHAVEAARCTVARAEDGDANAGEDVLAGAVIGLRTILDLNEPADPHRVVFLRALLKSLERIEQGADPGAALHLKNGHRKADEFKGVRDVFMFVSVGKRLDALTLERGHTRQDSPTDAALKAVAKEEGYSFATVQKAWLQFGGAAGWEARRTDWK